MRMEVVVARLSGRKLSNMEVEEEERGMKLPGFRFHPTDKELVLFYLRRKVEKKPMQVIRQLDIYSYDPWDLPKAGNVGEVEELYFFCKRGRKYRNSQRPNRVVTGSGFWKATGIDRPIYASEGGPEPHHGRPIIGLKKCLVYYRGSAGKGTKTDWMMHEFRLPPATGSYDGSNLGPHSDKGIAKEEAEVWTLCKIFKRIPSNGKNTTAYVEQSSMICGSLKYSDHPIGSSSMAGSGGLETPEHSSELEASLGGHYSTAVVQPMIEESTAPPGVDYELPPFLGTHHCDRPCVWNLDSDSRLVYESGWDELGFMIRRDI
ncbi:hypothetical protein SAY87_032340 [Trapa incisa]|uniref:NAC domain-containing protein n=1 Tax=Trapa incisa TaxID=236973 RepID=A0AAN7GMC1_9MYRT|nr:hypothetical protein SAY87_032340 [Trapa incisa]